MSSIIIAALACLLASSKIQKRRGAQQLIKHNLVRVQPEPKGLEPKGLMVLEHHEPPPLPTPLLYKIAVVLPYTCVVRALV